jgi:hypothetical protein
MLAATRHAIMAWRTALILHDSCAVDINLRLSDMMYSTALWLRYLLLILRAVDTHRFPGQPSSLLSLD